MSLRNEQCNKVCRILDDVLANRPTERDSLITAVRKAFGALEKEPQWVLCSERLPEDMQFVLLTVRRLKNEYNHEPFISVGYIGWNQQHWWCAHDGDCEIGKVEVIAWMPLPEPYNGGES